MNPYVLAVLAVLAWIVVATVVALAVGRAIRFRDRQVPRQHDAQTAQRRTERTKP